MNLKSTGPWLKPASDWGRSCPGDQNGRASRNKPLETALVNCGYPFCFTVGEDEAPSRIAAHVAFILATSLIPEGQFRKAGGEFGGFT